VVDRLGRDLAAGRSEARTAGCYLPREVFFGRLGFSGAFFTVWASDFGRFLPATSDSFPIDVLPGAPYRGSRRPWACVGFCLASVYTVAARAALGAETPASISSPYFGKAAAGQVPKVTTKKIDGA